MPLTSKKFDLNIESVLENWDVSDAIREIIANAMDEQLLTASQAIEIFKNEDTWHIRDFGRGIEYKHLTQNENPEKLNSALAIGKFGVGLKDALATFDRKNITVIIKSKFGDITIEKSTKHEFDTILTLHAIIQEPSESAMVGTEFLLKNVHDDSIAQAKQRFLKFSGEHSLESTPYGEVLQGKAANNRYIYIRGLKVAEEDNFLFSYNITSLTAAMRKALNRERKYVGRTAYTERVKAILQACQSKEVALLLVADLQEYQTGKVHDELKWADVATHASRILNSVSKAIFMTPEQLSTDRSVADLAKKEGYQVVIIPENVAHKISGSTDVNGNAIRDVTQYVKEQVASYQFDFVNPEQLTSSELTVFNSTNQILDLIGNRSFLTAKNIYISNTMRPSEKSHSTLGLWMPDKRQIIVKRSQLSNLSSFSGTLLHALAHANSGADDVSREFEEELTNLLGIIAEKAISLSAGFFSSTKNRATEAKLLSGIIDNHQYTFLEEKISPNGNCGFTALGATRTEVVECLIPLISNIDVCSQLSEEIQQAFETSYLRTERSASLIERRDQQQFIYDHLFRELREQYPLWQPQLGQEQSVQEASLISWLNTQSLFEQSQHLAMQRLSLSQAEEALKVYCQQPNTVKTYLEALGKEPQEGGLWLGYKSALLYAQHQNITLYIWRKNDTPDAEKLTLIDFHQAANPKNIIHILHTDGFTHFNLLIDKDTLSDEQNSLSKRQRLVAS